MRARDLCKLFLRVMLAAAGASGHAFAADCAQLEAAANKAGARVPGHASGYTVTGTGRLQFHSAPSKACKMNGVFIVPGDTVTAYVVHEGFASIQYFNLKAGTDASGWVELARLKPNGTGIAPRQ